MTLERAIGLTLLAILILLVLVSCSSTEPVSIKPTLACPQVVRCTAIVWHVGLGGGLGTFVEGSHLKCRCVDD